MAIFNPIVKGLWFNIKSLGKLPVPCLSPTAYGGCRNADLVGQSVKHHPYVGYSFVLSRQHLVPKDY